MSATTKLIREQYPGDAGAEKMIRSLCERVEFLEGQIAKIEARTAVPVPTPDPDHDLDADRQSDLAGLARREATR